MKINKLKKMNKIEEKEENNISKNIVDMFDEIIKNLEANEKELNSKITDVLTENETKEDSSSDEDNIEEYFEDNIEEYFEDNKNEMQNIITEELNTNEDENHITNILFEKVDVLQYSINKVILFNVFITLLLLYNFLI
jgi:hypothetical protein